MIADELAYHIRSAFGHTPTAEQERAIQQVALFLSDRREQSVLLLRGSAGTGKTTLAAAIVRALQQLKQKLILLAPTGRAAKVFSLYADHPAFTIHRRIYRQRTAGDLSVFNLNDNLYRDTLFIIDEASMISHGSGDETFGSGDLLDDLVRFVYNGQNCRMILIGDTAQLPPVGERQAPALMTDVLQGYGLITYECDLSEVLRQSQQSGILWNATRVRKGIEKGVESGEWRVEKGEFSVLNSQFSVLHSQLRLKGFTDIVVVKGDELIESIATSYSRVGLDDTIIITRSNKRANIYNQGIRNTVLDREEELCRGDRLMIVKNNYSLPFAPFEEEQQRNTAGSPAAHRSDKGALYNGDRCVVQRVRHYRELYGFRFADVTLSFPDYDNYELTAPTLLDTLTTEAPALTREQQEQLYNKVMEDYADIPLKTDRLRKLKSDAHYNALQVKFGYAVTCHKAQGGQWAHVYIDQGYMTDDMLDSDYLHWLYTALTRATEKVFLVNWPEKQLEQE